MTSRGLSIAVEIAIVVVGMLVHCCESMNFTSAVPLEQPVWNCSSQTINSVVVVESHHFYAKSCTFIAGISIKISRDTSDTPRIIYLSFVNISAGIIKIEGVLPPKSLVFLDHVRMPTSHILFSQLTTHPGVNVTVSRSVMKGILAENSVFNTSSLWIVDSQLAGGAFVSVALSSRSLHMQETVTDDLQIVIAHSVMSPTTVAISLLSSVAFRGALLVYNSTVSGGTTALLQRVLSRCGTFAHQLLSRLVSKSGASAADAPSLSKVSTTTSQPTR